MISFNNSQLSLKSLENSLIEIKKNDSINKYEFNDFKYELDKIEYEKKIKTESVLRINEWIESVPHHTFPKKKNRWINTMIAQSDLRNIVIYYELEYVMNSKFLKGILTSIMLNHYTDLYNKKTKLNICVSILCNLNPIDIFDYLIESKLLSMNGRRVYINRYILDLNINKELLNENNKRAHNNSLDMNSNSEIITKKRRFN